MSINQTTTRPYAAINKEIVQAGSPLPRSYRAQSSGVVADIRGYYEGVREVR